MTSPDVPSPASALPRVVLDTNVVLSALVFTSGAAARLRQAWQQGLCLPLVSTATTQELVRVLAYPKFGLSAAEREELLADYLPHAEVVNLPSSLPAMPACRDPHDLPFLHLAHAGSAQALITGDKDLLVLAGQLPFQIVSCQAWLLAVGLTSGAA